MWRFLSLQVAILLISCTRVAIAQHGATTLADSCLPRAQFTLSGVRLGLDSARALHTLGRPLRVKTDSSADDGGNYEYATYYYHGLEMDVVRGVVDRLLTHSPSVVTPLGLRPGISRARVLSLTRARGLTVPRPVDTLEIRDCELPNHETLGGYIVLVFNTAGQVQSVEIFHDRP